MLKRNTMGSFGTQGDNFLRLEEIGLTRGEDTISGATILLGVQVVHAAEALGNQSTPSTGTEAADGDWS